MTKNNSVQGVKDDRLTGCLKGIAQIHMERFHGRWQSQPQGRRTRVWLKRTWANLLIYTLTFLFKVLPSQLPQRGSSSLLQNNVLVSFHWQLRINGKEAKGAALKVALGAKSLGKSCGSSPSTGAMVLRPWVLGSDFCLQHSLAIRQVTTSPSFIFLTCEMGTRNSSWQGYYEDKWDNRHWRHIIT